MNFKHITVSGGDLPEALDRLNVKLTEILGDDHSRVKSLSTEVDWGKASPCRPPVMYITAIYADDGPIERPTHNMSGDLGSFGMKDGHGQGGGENGFYLQTTSRLEPGTLVKITLARHPIDMKHSRLTLRGVHRTERAELARCVIKIICPDLTFEDLPVWQTIPRTLSMPESASEAYTLPRPLEELAPLLRQNHDKITFRAKD